MKQFKNISALFLLSSLALFASCKRDHNNDVVSKKGLIMSGAQEVPVRTTEASGTVDVSYNKKTHMLTYSLTWANLTDAPTGAHIHGTAPRGENAPVKHPFTEMIPKVTSGSFSNSVLVDGVAIKEDSLLNGFYYVNIHTPENPGGEIRGQLEFK